MLAPVGCSQLEHCHPVAKNSEDVLWAAFPVGYNSEAVLNPDIVTSPVPKPVFNSPASLTDQPFDFPKYAF
jgi:hypothetical protein